jgi:glyoxylase-like metal-dependent hydrolase (beta-lactamase superfamily II)
MIAAPNPSPMTLDGTRAYIVGLERPCIIDPGPDHPGHLAAIERALNGARPTAILLTHAHPDHAAGAPRLAERLGCPIRMGRGAITSSIPTARVARWLADGDRIEIDGGTIEVIATPGHAPEHLAFLWRSCPAERGEGAGAIALFVGDLLMGQGDTTLVAGAEGSLRDYLDSLERIRALGAAMLVPTHGPPIADPEEAISRYRGHREQRIAQVAAALRANPRSSPADLVSVIYGSTLDPALSHAAEASISKMVEYLGEVE